MSKLSSALTIILILIILIVAGAILFIALTPHDKDQFTEFYLLNQDGKASAYPSEIKAGQPLVVVLGIVNHEGSPSDYKIQIEQNGVIIKTVTAGVLQKTQKWEGKVDFTLDKTGVAQRIEFYIFLNNEEKPHIKDPLVLIVDATK